MCEDVEINYGLEQTIVQNTFLKNVKLIIHFKCI